MAGASMTTGNGNTLIGAFSGMLATGSNNVFIGHQAGFNETGSDKLVIANSETTPPLIYGDFSSGFVGLGTITPSAKLNIANGALRITNTTDNKHYELSYDATDNYFYLDEFGVARHLYIKNGGNTGIGRNPTANKFEVEGNASKTTATAWLANSDKRIKTDIQNIDNSFEIIMKLHPVKFRYNDEWKKKHPSIEDTAKKYFRLIPITPKLLR